MLFNSYAFLVLVSTTLVFYYHRKLERNQVFLLIVSSIVFYGYSQPYLVILLTLSAATNAVTSYTIFFEERQDKRKFYAIAGVVFNLSVLGFFKYARLLDSF